MMELIDVIAKADTTEIDDALNAVIQRKRELYPDWEIVYYAQKKGEPVNMELILKLLGQKEGE